MKRKKGNVENHWMSISDMMSALMIIFLFISIAFMIKTQEKNKELDEIIRDSKQVKAEIYTTLNREFEDDFKNWGADLDPNTLSVRFKAPDILFKGGKDEPGQEFKAILDVFFPKYIKVLSNPYFKRSIQEIRIEGHTSSDWGNEKDGSDVAYLENMVLSQGRAREVHKYVYTNYVQSAKDAQQRDWLIKKLTANGLSFSQRILENGIEDKEKSRRLEFRIRTNADEKMNELEGKR